MIYTVSTAFDTNMAQIWHRRACVVKSHFHLKPARKYFLNLVPILCLLCSVPFLQSHASAEQTSPHSWKDWSEYSEQEKDSLRARWTEQKVQEVVKALTEGKPLPVKRLPPREYEYEQYPPAYRKEAAEKSYDLRGIPLEGFVLRGFDLRFTHLEGALLHSAHLDRANLQDANLKEANLQDANLKEANLQDADLEHASLQGASLWQANLQDSNLREANLQGAELGQANLQGAYLWHAYLQHAYLGGANLQDAGLEQAILQGANLWRANLQGASLWHANLQDAYLKEANLQGAELGQANLQGAMLGAANLQDTDFFQTRFDRSHLAFANFGEAKNIRYVVWGDSLHKRYLIGEEENAASPLQLQIAEDTYRDLKIACRKEGLDETAREFLFRENEVRTKKYRWHHPIRILRLLFLKWTYGYGSRPMWLLWYSLVLLCVFAAVFTLLTLPRSTRSGIYLVEPHTDTEKESLLTFRKGRLFLDCFYFSLLSFATFGYGALRPRQWLEFFRLEPVEYKPVGWARILVGIEAALGIYLLALLATVLFGRR